MAAPALTARPPAPASRTARAGGEFLGTGAPRRGEDFADHQRRTTANVACDTPIIGPFLSWLMGGLQLQIEHHLAPGMPHTACPVLARRIEARCAEKGLDYVVYPNLWTAVAAHYRWLASMESLLRRPAPPRRPFTEHPTA